MSNVANIFLFSDQIGDQTVLSLAFQLHGDVQKFFLVVILGVARRVGEQNSEDQTQNDKFVHLKSDKTTMKTSDSISFRMIERYFSSTNPLSMYISS